MIYRIVFLLLIISQFVVSQEKHPLQTKDSLAQIQWVNDTYNAMTLEEKIGQLFIADVWSAKEKAHTDKIKELIKKYHIGGVMFSKGGPYRQAKLTNEYQALSKTKLLITQDAEWGLSMRLDSTYAFPWNMTLGAIKDNQLIKEVGKQIGEHCKRVGVHMNFAPDIDINTNPLNPIIGNRSFGEDKDNVAAKGVAFMKGMDEANVLGSAKHFPGHGDTSQDSHKTLPTIDFDAERIENVELYPFKKLIENGVASIMVAHLNIPSLGTKTGKPSSLSKKIVTDLLKDKLGYKGLIFTDALNMKGASNYKEPGEVDLAAFMAGNDILLISKDIPKAVAKIKKAYEKKNISEDRLAHSVKKILMAKYKVGLNNHQPVELANIHSDLLDKSNDLLYSKLIDNAITVVKNKEEILPVGDLTTTNIAYVKMGESDNSAFISRLNKYAKVTEVKASHLDDLIKKLSKFNLVIVGVHKSNVNPWKSYKLKDKEVTWLYEIARTNKVILDVFTRPYALLDLKTTNNFESIVLSYQNSKIAQEKSADAIFGSIAVKGKLPVSANTDFPVNTSVKIEKTNRLGFNQPENHSFDVSKLEKIDSIVNYAISEKMTPGVQLVIAKGGDIIYNKNYGYQTYAKKQRVTDETLYDVASLTKIVSTLPLLMEMEEQGIVDLNDKLGELLPELSDSNKKQITIKQMLSHYARLKAWIPFYLKTLDSVHQKPMKEYYRKVKSDSFPYQVAKNLYISKYYKQDSIFNRIKETDLYRKWRYKYSDLPYYILKKYIENHYQTGLDELIQNRFYRPMGLTATYNPLKKYPVDIVAPTEEDQYFRYQQIKGYVHDMGAAMQDGVGGHAGVFATATDIAKIMQMYIQGGSYAGKQYLKPSTINKFNKTYYEYKKVRRGVGFDKPQLGEVGPTCDCVPMVSFGHSGFTGTFAWADPENELVYVFLSNRTYPDAANFKLVKEDIRSEIQRVIYEAIGYVKPEHSAVGSNSK
ncbi:glycoside hydrolase family 3 N-terminal domain-containing protein [Pseudofulvibacter geojedonensis]|uniref:beta-N-acetylhexosaminidase n=1 Tax=Pseudofulvibacter geojedonensis TaxID=1123758 RepID=A0ABW3I3X4_9FLAO